MPGSSSYLVIRIHVTMHSGRKVDIQEIIQSFLGVLK